MKRMIFIVFYFFSALSFGQQPALIPFFSRAEKWETGQFVGKDNFGNFYSIHENEFKKNYS